MASHYSLHDSGDMEDDEISVHSSEDENESPQSSPDTSDSEESDDRENVWEKLQYEAIHRHADEWQALVTKFEANGDNEKLAAAKAHNTLVPKYRKEFREVLFEKLQWFHKLRRNSMYQKVMETKQHLIDTEGFDWAEAIQTALHKRKFLLNKLFEPQSLPEASPDDINCNRRFGLNAHKFY